MLNNYFNSIKVVTLLLALFVGSLGTAQNNPTTQTLTGGATINCPQDNVLILQSSEIGFNYYLRKDNNKSIIGAPKAGTANSLTFMTGKIASTNAYHAFASNPSYALDFDGVNDHITIPHHASLNFTSAVTIEAWIYPTTISKGFHEIYRKDNAGSGRMLLSFQDTGKTLAFGTHTTIDGYTELDVSIDSNDYINQWVHIMATFDNTTNAMRIYRNGVLIGTKVSNGSLLVSGTPSPARVGSYNGTSEFFKGKIASLRLWNKAIASNAEIEQVKINLFEGNESNLVAYYPFFENTGLVLTEKTTNANNGTINGATWASGTAGGVGKIVSNTQTITYSVPTTVYVDINATGNNTGCTWEDAFTSVQDAADLVAKNGEIHIAKGTYKEGKVIIVTNPISIKGGFPTGGGTQDIANNPTILDGNDSNQVILLSGPNFNETHFMEGLTIQNGRATGIAGIRCITKLNLNEVIITKNTATSVGGSSIRGGGVHGNVITMTNCKVIGNTCGQAEFGNLSSTFKGTGEGGGIYGTTITLTNTVVSGNTISYSILVNGNLTAKGGGIYGTNILLTDCIVSKNTASTSVKKNNPTISSTSLGGGVYGDTIKIINSLVANNTASSFISNSTSATSTSTGGGIYGNAILENSILWGNTKSTDGGVTLLPSEQEMGTITSKHSVVKGQNPTGLANIDATASNFGDTTFVDASNCNFGLMPNAVLLDAGNDTYNSTSTDLARSTRKAGTIDIGPYESNFSGKDYLTSATTYYFNVSSSASMQDGLSWSTAFNSLNDYFYIQNKSNISKIYVAKGKYKTKGTLKFTTHLELFGGYNASTNMPAKEQSVIDVEQNGRIIHATKALEVSSCVLKNGLVSTNDTATCGGGILGTKIILTNCKVMGNYLSSFSLSEVSKAYGGGIYGDSITLTNSSLLNNTTFSAAPVTSAIGGGIYGNSIDLNQCKIIGNTALSFKTNFSNSSSDTSISMGGGIFGNKISISNSILSGNRASFAYSSTCGQYNSKGGAIYGTGTIDLTNSSVSQNVAYSTYCKANAYGGGIYGEATITLTNSNVTKNSVIADAISGTPVAVGGGVYGHLILQNSILWDNLAVKSLNNKSIVPSEHDSGTLDANYSLIKGQNPSGTNNFDATINGFDPLFKSEANGDFRLLENSPLIDAGLNSYNSTSIDLGSNKRIKGGFIDIGAYESKSPCENATRVAYVDSAASGNKDGSSWANAFTNLQDALDLRMKCSIVDSILVAQGTYFPTKILGDAYAGNPRNVAFHLADSNVILIGGYNANTGAPNVGVTNLSGNIGTPSSSDNSYHVFVFASLDSTSQLNNVTLSNGQADSTGFDLYKGYQIYKNKGAGLSNINSDLRFDKLTIENNRSSGDGGGIYNDFAVCKFTQLECKNNKSENLGGAVCNNNSTIHFLKSIFIGNNASNGGGVFNSTSTAYFNEVAFTENSVKWGGGGVYSTSSSIFSTNVVFAHNTARWGGASNDVASNHIQYTNVTFFNNSATSQGGAVLISQVPNKLVNCLFLKNDAPSGKVITMNGTSPIDPSSGYIASDGDSTFFKTVGPGFVNLEGLDSKFIFVDSVNLKGVDNKWFTRDDGLNLTSSSIVIGKGTSTGAPATDITGISRQNPPSLGAYEGLVLCDFSSSLPILEGTYTSSVANTSDGYLCFCDANNKLLLALDTIGTGTVIPTNGVQLQIGPNATTSWINSGGIVENPYGGAILNRRWEVFPTVQPTKGDVKVRYFFTKAEYQALKDTMANHNGGIANYPTTINTVADLEMFKLTGGTPFGDPHDGGAIGILLKNGSTPTTETWVHSMHGSTNHIAEYMVSSFSGGGAGIGGGGQTLPMEQIDKSLLLPLVLYPNPSNGKIKLAWFCKANEASTVLVFDLQGRKVFNQSFEAKMGYQVKSLNLNHLISGVYLVQLKNDGNSQEVKLIIK